jgi:hypothetical protein
MIKLWSSHWKDRIFASNFENMIFALHCDDMKCLSHCDDEDVHHIVTTRICSSHCDVEAKITDIYCGIEAMFYRGYQIMVGCIEYFTVDLAF